MDSRICYDSEHKILKAVSVVHTHSAIIVLESITKPRGYGRAIFICISLNLFVKFT